MSMVSVDVENARAILSKIDAAADTYKAHVQEAKALLEELETCWVGQSGIEVRAKLSAWIKQQEQIGNGIQSAASNVRYQVNRFAEIDAALADTISGS